MEQKILKLIGVKGTFKKDVVPMMNYSSANITTSGAGYVVSLFYLKFLTDVVNLKPELAGLVTMVAVLWDAVTDPIMGVIADRTRSKYGKHRRYILWGMPLFCVSFLMMWNGYGFDGREEPVKTFIYFTVSYMLYKTAYTIIDIPHVAMLPELAPDYDLRIQYNSVGYIFNSFGMFPSFFLASAILGIFGFSTPKAGAQKPMLIMGIILAIVYGICLFITFKRTRERSSLNLKVEKFDFKALMKEYKYVFINRSFRQYFFMSLTYNIATFFYTTTLIYYIEYIAKLPTMYTIFTTIAGVFEASSFPLNYALTIKFGKKKCGTIVTPLMVAGFAVCLLMNPTAENESSIIWKIILMATAVLYPFGKSGLGYVAQNILPDISDVDEAITGRRREGVIGTFNTFIKKTVSGVMSSVVMFILGGFGLIVGDELDEILKVNPDFQQSSSALLGVRICITFVPIAFTLISLFLLYRFKMTKKDHTIIRAAVATKHKYGSVALSEEEIAIVEDITGQKYETTWLGKNNGKNSKYALEPNEDGEYQILIDIEEEMKRIRNSKEGKKALNNDIVAETKIDINQKEPAAPEKGFMTSLKALVFYLIQWTWGLSVNLVGGIAYLICTKLLGYRWQRFGYSRIVFVPWKGGGLSLGLFIFMKNNHSKKTWTYNTRIHEYGHTWQCLLLGPLYWIIIAIPSFIWCNCFAGYRKKNNVPYSALYCESWANSWGQKFSKMKQTEQH